VKERGNVPRRFYPADSLSSPRFTGPFTFARLPHSRELESLDAVFVGVPFDGGVVFRAGARFGPSAVRQSSLLLRLYNPALGVNPFDVLNVADYGDVNVVPGDIEVTYTRIAEELGVILDRGVTPLVCGGDHSITLPILRQVSERCGEVSVIHIDAHLDMVESHFSQRYTHGTVFRRALDEGLIDPESSAHLAIRGSLFSDAEILEARRMGFKLFTMEELEERGISAVCRELVGMLEGRPVYISFDIDSCDPSYAPGTGTPEVGGLTSREALRLLRGLAGLSIAGFDLVEVAPPYDHGEITSILAANLIFEALSLIAIKRWV